MENIAMAQVNATLPRSRKTPYKNCLAKALYDNIAEAPDEIAFRKGAVLTVLEQNTQGLEGWWLCSLRGRQGIAPGNRLRILPGMYDPSGMGFAGDGTAMPENASTLPGTFPGPGIRHSRRRSWHVNPNKVVMPQKVGDVYLYDVPVGTRVTEEYDVPTTRARAPLNHSLPYDIPPGSQAGSYDTPPSPRAVVIQSTYDEPRSNAPVSVDPGVYDEPRLTYPESNTYHTPWSGKIHDYDVPTAEMPQISKTTTLDAYGVPLSGRSSGVSLLSTSSSSLLSSTSGHSSLNASLSLSSLCGSNRSSMEPQFNDLYDIPQSDPRRVCTSTNVISTTFPSRKQADLNDVTPTTKVPQTYDLPPTPRLAQKLPQKLHVEGPYDVPPQVTRDVSPCTPKAPGDEVNTVRRLSATSTGDVLPPLEGKELPLALDAAMEMLMNRHQEVQACINKLFSFISATWRKRENLEAKVYDIQVTCQKLRNTLSEFLDFTYGALANSVHATDKTLSYKLFKLIKPLVDSNTIVETTTQSLDDKGWLIAGLISSDEPGTPDELDQLVACARGLTEDVRLVASFIQGNSSLIFKRSTLLIDNRFTSTSKTGGQMVSTLARGHHVQERPLPSPPVHITKVDDEFRLEGKEWMNDYDYVSLESKATVERENEEIKAALPSELRQSFENLVKQSEIPVQVKEDSKSIPIENSSTDSFHQLSPNDRQLVHFYSAQVEIHMLHLTNAIDAFLTTVKNNQPPKIFIGHSKFVVIGAHKMIYIGDTLHRNASSSELKTRVMRSSDALCESLKTLVASTKKAALQYPSVVAVQEMIDSVVDVSHVAKALQVTITQAAIAF
ncbi:breast cancer anti-estrogen resistance protein 1-like isoform X2 [Limulus polyphemus]|uniref:Breast cancer anti-estrogen resistance protein 1-like isoform X2 n=1 Tax=Limulus polyphemus TaxID=6850 RepID=A0ABM1BE66_LIMPO|nr:breast cancer anti-estrogen resistance protein 1-like isoform X2 [Limulus polyphemus]